MDLSLLVMAGCALALVCVGVVALIAFFGVRFLAGTADAVLDDVAEDEYPVETRRRSRWQPLRPGTLEQGPVSAQSVQDDFEAQVMRRLQGEKPPQTPRPGAQDTLHSVLSDDPPRSGDLRSQRTRRRDHDDEPYYDDWDGGDLNPFDDG